MTALTSTKEFFSNHYRRIGKGLATSYIALMGVPLGGFAGFLLGSLVFTSVIPLTLAVGVGMGVMLVGACKLIRDDLAEQKREWMDEKESKRNQGIYLGSVVTGLAVGLAATATLVNAFNMQVPQFASECDAAAKAALSAPATPKP